jgi:YfiH family protein
MRATWRAFPASADAAPGALLRIDAGPSVAAGFTTRHGGRSRGDLASLNLSRRTDDDASVVEANRSRVLDALGVPASRWVQGEQIHAGEVARIGPDRATGDSGPVPGVDGLVAAHDGIALSVLVADCVPVLIVDPATPSVGVAHAGWRGLAARIIERTVEAMPGQVGLAAYIGPSIGPCCFEVGDEVADEMTAAFDPSVRIAGGARPYVDLWRASAIALRRAGVERVGLAAACTRCEPHRWFSHRAGATGRQALVAALR